MKILHDVKEGAIPCSVHENVKKRFVYNPELQWFTVILQANPTVHMEAALWTVRKTASSAQICNAPSVRANDARVLFDDDYSTLERLWSPYAANMCHPNWPFDTSPRAKFSWKDNLKTAHENSFKWVTYRSLSKNTGSCGMWIVDDKAHWPLSANSLESWQSLEII